MLQKEIVIQQMGRILLGNGSKFWSIVNSVLMTIVVTDSRESIDQDNAVHELLAKRHLIGTTEELERAYSHLQQELAQAKEQLTRSDKVRVILVHLNALLN